jgi:hypothetical protein
MLMRAKESGHSVPTIREALLADIDAFCKRWSVTRTEFGRMAAGDATFVSRLKAGSSIGINRVDKVRAFMRGYTGPAAE